MEATNTNLNHNYKNLIGNSTEIFKWQLAQMFQAIAYTSLDQTYHCLCDRLDGEFWLGKSDHQSI
ncbi:hypothetical protein [Merismopedia glauca]|uniref:Uncharacterized protein n=1 Tax=Merismopedia glauca CCAP 1448/3 TaxID=1296344 RepID=A0A2T1C0A8_9CYAN|nr:hypothetical protein [Merismopedia glauca]PSB01709.1 hypothetical protein C7B64_16885 [Merismopedia glauca CCAP 1448/3]